MVGATLILAVDYHGFRDLQSGIPVYIILYSFGVLYGMIWGDTNGHVKGKKMKPGADTWYSSIENHLGTKTA